MFLLVGLGNIGAQYHMTRHNAGFIALDSCVSAYDLQSAGAKFHAECFKGMVGTTPVFAIKPHTLMNRSGIAVSEAARFFKIPLEHIIVFYDDLDLTLAKCRIKKAGGHGGHNGLRDIDDKLGKEYWRVRMGIDRPNHKGQVTSYVLSPFDAAELERMERLSSAIARHLPHVLAREPEKAMTAIALDMQV
jgi:peptidyl-tRNA hydrolase, PTH1 family